MQVSNTEEISEEFAAVAQAIKFMHFAIDRTKPTLESGICTKLQQAVSELTPSFANIAIAVRELLKMRLLVPSQILVRTLLDRLATISYLRKNGDDAIQIWDNGWQTNGRPTFKQKLGCIPDDIYPTSQNGHKGKSYNAAHVKVIMTELLKEMHGSVHGDFESVEDTLLYHDGKLSMHVIGPDIQNVPFFNKICSLLVCIVMFFVFEIEQTFLPNKLEAKK